MQKLTFTTFVAAMIAVAVTQTTYVRVINREDHNDGFGNFRSFYELSDGTVVEQRGELKNAGTPNEEFVISGFYSYIAPNGEVQRTEYVANKDGDHKTTSFGPKHASVLGYGLPEISTRYQQQGQQYCVEPEQPAHCKRLHYSLLG